MRASKERKYVSMKEKLDHQRSAARAYLKLPSKAKLFQPKAGIVLIDIIPFVAGKGNPTAEQGQQDWERTFHVHKNIGPNSMSVLCPASTANKPCPICRKRVSLSKAGEDEDEVDSLRPKKRQLFNVIDRKNPEAGVQVWDFSYHNFGRLLNDRLSEEDAEEQGWWKFFLPTEGLTLRVSLTNQKTGGYTYLEATSIDFRERKKQYKDSIVDEAFCLDDLLLLKSKDEIADIFAGADGDDEEDDDDGDEEEQEKGRPRKHTKDDDDSDEDEDEDEEDGDEGEDGDGDEEEERPLKKSKKQRDEDEEDGDDEDEDEDEDGEEGEDEDEEEDGDEDEDEDEDEEEEEKPKPKPGKPKSKKKSPDDEDEDGDDWDDFDSDEDEDEDGEEGEDESDDEDEKPRRRRQRTKKKK